MFTSLFDKPSPENYKLHTDLYIQMENKKELLNLINEVKKIKGVLILDYI